jgi:hypothetical protein
MEIIEDNSTFNRTMGVRAIKYLLATTSVGITLRTEDFLRAIQANTEYEDENLQAQQIRVACHHLVALDNFSGRFDFGHFSVTEFFNADSKTNNHSKDIQKDFNFDAIWLLAGEIGFERITKLGQAAGNTLGRCVSHSTEAEVFWYLFFKAFGQQLLQYLKGSIGSKILRQPTSSKRNQIAIIAYGGQDRLLYSTCSIGGCSRRSDSGTWRTLLDIDPDCSPSIWHMKDFSRISNVSYHNTGFIQWQPLNTN